MKTCSSHCFKVYHLVKALVKESMKARQKKGMDEYVYVTPTVKSCRVMMDAIWRRSACNEQGKEMADTSRPIRMQLLQLTVGLLCERHLCNTQIPHPVLQTHTDTIQWMIWMRNSADSTARHTVTIVPVGLVTCITDCSSFHYYSVGASKANIQ